MDLSMLSEEASNVKSKPKPILDEKGILMYFHSALRNVGLFTSISIAMLGYSRFYREKSRLYNVSFVGISILFLVFSMMINLSIIKNTENWKKTHKKDILELYHLEQVPYFIIATNSLVLIFGLMTLYREFTK